MSDFMREPDCGGCAGQGAHSRRCRTQPGWMWHRLTDMADGLGDFIGSNDPEAANMAYSIAGRMRAKATASEACSCCDGDGTVTGAATATPPSAS